MLYWCGLFLLWWEAVTALNTRLHNLIASEELIAAQGNAGAAL
jgi:hypothetical protein